VGNGRLGTLLGMTLDELPTDWHDLYLTESGRISDLLDLLVSDQRSGAMYLFLCDREDRLRQPCLLGDLAAEPPGLDRVEVFAPFVVVLREFDPDGALLVAIVRPHGGAPSGSDRRWLDAASRACAAGGVRLLGLHVVTQDATFEVPG
jgi:hypothetical protein